MPQFLVAIHHANDYDTTTESAEMHQDIDALNQAMDLAGVKFFAGGLVHPPSSAKSLRAKPNGEITITDGPYFKTNEQVGGFWILNVATLEDALSWGRKATLACRAPVEVRQFY